MGNFSKEELKKRRNAKGKKTSSGKGKKYFLICLLIAVACAIPASVFAINFIKLNVDRSLAESELVINEVDTTYMDDGEYYATYTGGKLSATVGVTIEDGRMVRIAAYDFSNISLDKADKLFESVVKYQMLNTPDFVQRDYSEKVLLKAIEMALTNRSTTL